MGYRLPGAVLSLANRLLARAAPGIAPSRSVRPDGDPPDLHRVAPGELVDQVAEHAVALVADLATVAVIAMPERVDELRAALEARGVALAEPGEVEPDRPIVVVPAPLAKGLEFDGVIVVEPAEIVAGGRPRRAPAVRRAHPRRATPRDRVHRRAPAGARRRRSAGRIVERTGVGLGRPMTRVHDAAAAHHAPFGQGARGRGAGRGARRRRRHVRRRRRRRGRHPPARQLGARGARARRGAISRSAPRRATSTCAATPAR